MHAYIISGKFTTWSAGEQGTEGGMTHACPSGGKFEACRVGMNGVQVKAACTYTTSGGFTAWSAGVHGSYFNNNDDDDV